MYQKSQSPTLAYLLVVTCFACQTIHTNTDDAGPTMPTLAKKVALLQENPEPSNTTNSQEELETLDREIFEIE